MDVLLWLLNPNSKNANNKGPIPPNLDNIFNNKIYDMWESR